MQKVTIKEKEKQSKDIDWTKGYFIKTNTGEVVTATSKTVETPMQTKADVFYFVDKGGDHTWNFKDCFRPFEGTITVELE